MRLRRLRPGGRVGLAGRWVGGCLVVAAWWQGWPAAPHTSHDVGKTHGITWTKRIALRRQDASHYEEKTHRVANAVL
jgi:hypothetical protein